MLVRFGVKEPANFVVGGNDGAFGLTPYFLSQWSGRFLVTVDGCHAMGANGWCRAFIEGDGCRVDLRGMDV